MYVLCMLMCIELCFGWLQLVSKAVLYAWQIPSVFNAEAEECTSSAESVWYVRVSFAVNFYCCQTWQIRVVLYMRKAVDWVVLSAPVDV